MNETIVIYHGGCRDGFCAAWVVNKYFTSNGPKMDELDIDKISYFAGYYGQDPPDVKDKDVIIVDFCYPIEVMQRIMADCYSLTWLDHHKTAQPFYEYLELHTSRQDRFKYDFDNSRSGAGLAWDYFFLNEPRPWLVDYVEDRDLWLKKLPSSDLISSYIACLKFDFNLWDNEELRSIEEVSMWGAIAELKIEQYIREVCKNVYFVDIFKPEKDLQKILNDEIESWKHIPIVNICQVDCSEVMAELCKLYPNSPFSLYWFKRHDGMYQYGMRSVGDFDVSTVAKLFGGGGHKNAAGFQLNYLLQELK